MNHRALQNNQRSGNRQATRAFGIALVAALTQYHLYAQAQSTQTPKISERQFSIQVSENGSILFSTSDGITRIALRGFELQSQPALKTGKTTATQITDGDRIGLRVRYELIGERAAQFQAESLIFPRPDGVDVQLEVTGPQKEDLSQVRLLKATGSGGLPVAEIPVGLWQRQEAGYGTPYEKLDGLVFTSKWNDLPGQSVRLITPPPEQAWLKDFHWAQKDGYATVSPNIPLQNLSRDWYEGSFSILLTPDTLDAKAAKARAARRPISVSQLPTQRFNLWSDHADQVPFSIRVSNTSDEDQTDHIQWIARNPEGTVVCQGAEKITLKPMETRIHTITLPLGQRDLLFVECVGTSGVASDFFRTMVTSMPHFEYSDRESPFGISASWYGPDDTQGVALMKRLGIQWLRNGDANLWRSRGIRAMMHNDSPPGRLKTPEEREKFIRASLERCALAGNTQWEFGNEWNLLQPGIGKTQQNAESYARDWLEPIARIRSETNSNVKLLSLGVAGPDTRFLETIADHGAWNKFDILALHFGAGQFTADFDPPEEEIGYPQDQKQHYWTLLGPLRQIKKLSGRLGAKPIWLTEMYAPTGPRTGCTHRQAADMILMSYMMILSEGVEKAFTYQLNDGVWYSRWGVNPNDREYHFGLLNRDESLKPAALAYATAAENLTDAKFIRWLTFSDPLVRGVLFDTPRGQLTAVWYRGDGYQLHVYKPISVSPEPWVTGWRTTRDMDFAAEQSVTALDTIGRRKSIQPRDGKISLKLDGSPILLYGLNTKSY